MDKTSSAPTLADIEARMNTKGEEARAIQAEKQKKTTYTLRELKAMDIPETPMLYAPIFMRTGLAVVYGDSDLGKSTWLRQMAMYVAEGRNFLGWKYQGIHHRAIYYSSEDGLEIVVPCIKRYDKSIHLLDEALDNLIFEFNLTPDGIEEDLKNKLQEQPADLVVIDAFGDAFDGKVNSIEDVRQFYAKFNAIAEKYGCLIVFNHHSGKRLGGFAPSKDNSLGSQAITAKPRLAIELRQDPDNIEVVHICITKGNYIPPKEKSQSFAITKDENFVFYLTGERADIATLIKDEKKVRQPKQPDKIADEKHIAFLSSFIVPNDGWNKSKWKEKIQAHFDVGSTNAGKFVNYYADNGWLILGDKRDENNGLLYRLGLIKAV